MFNSSLTVTFQANLVESGKRKWGKTTKVTTTTPLTLLKENIFYSQKYGSFRLSDEYDGDYYVIFNIKVSLEKAVMICKDVGTLLIIGNKNDQKFIENFANGTSIWLGSKLLKTSSYPKIDWVNSTVSNYENWAPDGHICPSECCGLLMKMDGRWSAWPCEFNSFFICKAKKEFLDDTDSRHKIKTSSNIASNDILVEIPNMMKEYLNRMLLNITQTLESQITNLTQVENNKMYDFIDEVITRLESKINNSTQAMESKLNDLKSTIDSLERNFITSG